MRFTLLLILALFSLQLLSFAGKTYPVYKILAEPVLDGVLDDYAWQRLPEGRGFHYLDSRSSFIFDNINHFKMGYTDDYLYVAADCRETDPESIKAMDSYRDGWSFDDAMEMFFLCEETGAFWQILCNAKGARWAKNLVTDKEIEPDPNWELVAGRTENSWTLETRIPFAMLNIKNIDQVKFNIARNAPTKKFKQHQSWIKSSQGYADKDNFALLVKHDSNGPADLEKAAKEINADFDRAAYLALLALSRKERAWQETEKQFGSSGTFNAIKEKRDWLSANINRMDNSTYGRVYADWLHMLSNASAPERSLSIRVDCKNLSKQVFLVNGTAISSDNGTFTFKINEGVNSIAFSAEAAADASIRFSCNEFPELNERWAFYNGQVPADWTDIDFEDLDWKDYSEKLPAGKVALRQLIIWAERHDSRYRCLNPSVNRWNFSLDSTETVYLSLYSSTELPVNKYIFSFTLPEGFELLDMEEGYSRNRLSLAPIKVNSEKVASGTRYELLYKAQDIIPEKTADSLLGIYKDKSGKAGDQGNIPYARLINNNVTEIGASLPYALLPEINGRRLQKFIMSMYNGVGAQHLSEELIDAQIKDSLNCGMDSYTAYAYPQLNRWAKAIANAGGKHLGLYGNHPIWGSKYLKGAVTQLLRDKPEIFCVYFSGIRKDQIPEKSHEHLLELQFCPSQVTGKFRNEFYEAIRKDYEYFFGNLPAADYLFLNWEQEPWNTSIYRKSTTPSPDAFCFCNLCKDNFRKWAKLAADADLSNENIFNNFYEEWRNFKYSLDADVHSIAIKAANDLGKKIYFYSWSNHYGYWEAAKDLQYKLFLGLPGNSTADARQQITMDDYMKFHRDKLGRRNIVGQRFVFFPQTYGWRTDNKEGWLKFIVMSDDGYIHPETWKWQVVRILATLQGGIDLQKITEMVSGVKYYVGEATRLIAEYEDVFYHGERKDSLVQSAQIAYPNALVLQHEKQRIVLLFNEGKDAKTVTIKNLQLKGNEKAKAYYSGKSFGNAAEFTLTIPANDLEAIMID